MYGTGSKMLEIICSSAASLMREPNTHIGALLEYCSNATGYVLEQRSFDSYVILLLNTQVQRA